MSIIRVTDEGIEVDGVLLRDNVDVKAFISSHRPTQVEVGFNLHQPYPLNVTLNTLYHETVSGLRDLFVSVYMSKPAQLIIYQGVVVPKELRLFMGVNQPVDLNILLGFTNPRSLVIHTGISLPLSLLIHLYSYRLFRDLTVTLGVNTVEELRAYLGSHPPLDLYTSLFLHLPKTLLVGIVTIPYHKFLVLFQTYHTEDLIIGISSHLRSLFRVSVGVVSPSELNAVINPVYIHTFSTWFFVVEVGTSIYKTYLRVIKSLSEDVYIYLQGWDMLNFTVPIKLSNPFSYTVPIWVWTPLDIITYINIVLPSPIGVNFIVEPEDGIDLRVIHGFTKMELLSVSISAWRTYYSLPTYIYGVYTSDHLVDFSMGGSRRLEVPLPGTSGYELLYITLKPSSRIMTTIIPIYIMELLDLYVSINQGWPCGFGSSYKLLTIEFDYAYLKALLVDFKVISGSGTPNLKVYINRAYFDTYRQSKSFQIYVPDEVEIGETLVVDSVPTTISTNFTRIRIGSIKVRFSWPRIKMDAGAITLSVVINPFPILTLPLDLRVSLWANRPDPPTQPGSRPIIMRESALDEPVWPQVFQVHEIELWGDDPPHVVRKIEIMFDTQVNIYYWVSSEQRAYAKEMWEQWAFLTRGYLPDAQYSGQIQYSTMHTLSTMVRYDTVDQAIRAMIAGFAYKGKSTLSVNLKGTGGLFGLSVYVDVRDFGRLYKLPVVIEPMHPYNLEINLTAN